jgi:hypothetical protein
MPSSLSRDDCMLLAHEAQCMPDIRNLEVFIAIPVVCRSLSLKKDGKAI